MHTLDAHAKLSCYCYSLFALTLLSPSCFLPSSSCFARRRPCYTWLFTQSLRHPLRPRVWRPQSRRESLRESSLSDELILHSASDDVFASIRCLSLALALAPALNLSSSCREALALFISQNKRALESSLVVSCVRLEKGTQRDTCTERQGHRMASAEVSLCLSLSTVALSADDNNNLLVSPVTMRADAATATAAQRSFHETRLS